MNTNILPLNYSRPLNSSSQSLGQSTKITASGNGHSEKKDVSHTVPAEIWCDIITKLNMGGANFNESIGIRAVSSNLKNAFESLSNINNRFVQKIGTLKSAHSWKEIAAICDNHAFNEEQFCFQIKEILGMTPYVKIILPYILDSNRQSIVLDVLFSKNNIQYLDLYAGDMGPINLNRFVNRFAEFLEKNKELKNFGILDFSANSFNEYHVKELSLALKEKNFREIIFDSQSVSEREKNNLARLFPSSNVSRGPAQVIITSKNELIRNIMPEIEAEDQSNIYFARKKRAQLVNSFAFSHFEDELDVMDRENEGWWR